MRKNDRKNLGVSGLHGFGEGILLVVSMQIPRDLQLECAGLA